VTGDEEIWGTAGWSADGRLVYFVSGRDGFACIWAQRLDPFTKKTEGEPFPVYHAHASGRSLSNVGGYDQAISATHDRIAFVLGEQTGSIWMAKWQE
jgi:hypothetical protein